MKNTIFVKGARQHNLKNVTLEIPRDQFVVFTGVSGSGKSSLVFNTLYAEGRRRLMESLSAYERMGLRKSDEADVDLIEGLSPVIAIEQKKISRSPRSTVGTLSNLSNYMRLLYSRVSDGVCPYCEGHIPIRTNKQIVSDLIQYATGSEVQIGIPLFHFSREVNGSYFDRVRKKGFEKLYWNGEKITIDEAEQRLRECRNSAPDRLNLDIGSIVVSPERYIEIRSLVQRALELGNGLMLIRSAGEPLTSISSHLACSSCGIAVSEIPASAFSFNTPAGACSTCTGLGSHYYVDPDLVIPDKTKSIAEGAVNLLGWQCDTDKFHKNRKIYEGLAQRYNFSLDTSVKDLSTNALHAVLYGTQGEKIRIENPAAGGKPMQEKFAGIVNMIYERFNTNTKDEMSTVKKEEQGVMREQICPDCEGTRLKAERLLYNVEGKTIHSLSNLPLIELLEFCEARLGSGTAVTQVILRDMMIRIRRICDIGLGYLTLNRPVITLSGGESQRLRLTTQLSSGLMGMIYILDEPSVGLHSKDNENMVVLLRKLRDMGNTLLVVEHDDEIISRADYIVDIGPGAGVVGGQIVAQGTVEELKKNSASLTGQYLSGSRRIEIPANRRRVQKINGSFKQLEIIGAQENNLKNVNVQIPLHCLVCITGVSGSGKSTLVHKVIYEKLREYFDGQSGEPRNDVELKGAEWIDRVAYVDQNPIGRTPRSNPATYVGIFNSIRKLFANTASAKQRGFKESHFSFNNAGGRCEECMGIGTIVTEMQFMSDVETVCEVCHGQRYSEELLGVAYRGKNIADILNMSIEEGVEFFNDHPALHNKLALMNKLGLGYMKLGQPATTLSGGEAQRIKLVEELSNQQAGCSHLYILDEPTSGLHLEDVQRLLAIVQQLVDQGNTVLVIEHNLHFIKAVDYLIDLGPGGGTHGGYVVAAGTPEDVAKVETSYTGQFLRKSLFDNEVSM
ncbi:excinuclease ABC subunit UvrA [Paenibacillus macquariensis]|uniref:UvrABC system protein A n=1 Tax=Paenibacillus macquariensis TaxID=948756 RepID=A0ABY1K2P9_9BACL|nr:excinuclease ABC subunit UvrA [Paenibacillus macquariensis]MEC0090194.1 excinuclease ABC subunit UvrA [Paenibacillus macquariensis]OAB39567.1 excinuclease ABC subunit A [Paenibacillus macquariensis subsp. macquariensis]SIR17139.1 excinuclease ABC subunit A [Paenibacillus macquariensis]